MARIPISEEDVGYFHSMITKNSAYFSLLTTWTSDKNCRIGTFAEFKKEYPYRISNHYHRSKKRVYYKTKLDQR